MLKMLCVMSGSHFFCEAEGAVCIVWLFSFFVKTEDAVSIVWLPVLVMLKKGV